MGPNILVVKSLIKKILTLMIVRVKLEWNGPWSYKWIPNEPNSQRNVMGYCLHNKLISTLLCESSCVVDREKISSHCSRTKGLTSYKGKKSLVEVLCSFKKVKRMNYKARISQSVERKKLQAWSEQLPTT